MITTKDLLSDSMNHVKTLYADYCTAQNILKIDSKLYTKLTANFINCIDDYTEVSTVYNCPSDKIESILYYCGLYHQYLVPYSIDTSDIGKIIHPYFNSYIRRMKDLDFEFEENLKTVYNYYSSINYIFNVR